MNKNLQILAVVLILVVIIYFAVRAIKNNAQNQIAVLDGGLTRTVEGSNAENALKNIPYLQPSWCVQANRKYNKLGSGYQFPNYLGTSEATRISNSIIDSKSILPFGVSPFNDSQKALTAIQLIETQAGAALVTIAFNNTTGKRLGNWLSWLSNSAIVEAEKHLSNLPTGVTYNGVELKTLSV